MLNEARGGGFVPSCSAKFEVTLHMITVHKRSGAPKRGAGSWDDSGGQLRCDTGTAVRVCYFVCGVITRDVVTYILVREMRDCLY